VARALLPPRVRRGDHLALIPIAIVVWKVDWVQVDETAIVLAVFAMATVLRRSTRVLPGSQRTRTL
jgi:hypothetical protein